MSEAKFTPGPWQAKDDLGVCTLHEDYDEMIVGPPGMRVDEAFFSDVPGRAEANARLIADAPAMLEMIDQLQSILESVMCHHAKNMPTADVLSRTRAIDRARQLVAKHRPPAEIADA